MKKTILALLLMVSGVEGAIFYPPNGVATFSQLTNDYNTNIVYVSTDIGDGVNLAGGYVYDHKQGTVNLWTNGGGGVLWKSISTGGISNSTSVSSRYTYPTPVPSGSVANVTSNLLWTVVNGVAPAPSLLRYGTNTGPNSSSTIAVNLGGGQLMSIPTNGITYVMQGGNDTLGGQNNGIPYATIQGALKYATNGDTIFVGPGNFTGAIYVPPSIRVFGSGYNTLINSGAALGSSSYLLDNCMIANCRFDGVVRPVGTNVVMNNVQVNTPTPVNAQIDALYLDNNWDRFVATDCSFYSTFDAVNNNTAGVGSQLAEFYNCRFVCDAGAQVNVVAGLALSFAANYRIYGGSIVVSNGTMSTSCLEHRYTGAAVGSIVFSGVTMLYGSTNGSVNYACNWTNSSGVCSACTMTEQGASVNPTDVHAGPLTVIGNNTTNFSVYAAGSAYTYTASDALVHLGTTDPTVTINQAGTYRIEGSVGIKYAAATYAGAQSITNKFRRTNNTAADLANGKRVIELPVLTTFTGGDVIHIPSIIYTAASGDIISVFGAVTATPSAGSVTADSAEIVATRLY